MKKREKKWRQRPEKRRGWLFGALGVCLLAAAVLLADAFLVEPNWIDVSRYDVPARVQAPLKIAQLSDLHTYGLGWRERRMLEILNREKPDVILITGDTLASNGGNYQMCRLVYQRLHAPLGVWFVRGNWENWRPLRHEREYYQSAGIHLLVNQSAELRKDVWLVGLDDPLTGTPALAKALRGIPEGVFTIVMFHSPGYFHRIAGQMDLCLAGHTHGGQVRIPFMYPLWLPGGVGRYLEGWYVERGTRMYVSRGLGMSVFPVRFNCRPELAFITLEP